MEDHRVALDWKLVREGSSLVVTYTVTNHLKERLFVLDQMLRFAQTTGMERAPDAVIVRPGAEGEPLRLVRGYLEPRSLPMVVVVPGARGVAPGDSIEGRATIPLPLASWHPNESSTPLTSQPRTAALEIGVLTGEIAWATQRLADGSEVTVPPRGEVATRQQLVRGEPLPLP